MCQGITKHAELILDESDIYHCIDRAYAIAISGRPGPVWIDVPIDIQSTILPINVTEILNSTYSPNKYINT